jgi:MFS transporter, DHA1 family, inner membrane transport protein
VVVAFAALGAGSFVYNAPQQHLLIELAPDTASVLVSLNSSAIYAGIGLSGLLGGLTLQFGPATNCAVGAAVALLVVLVTAPRRRASRAHTGRRRGRER